jgi:translocation protein SEC62
LGIGDWGLGIGPNPQSPIPNPQSPIPMYFHSIFSKKINNINFFKEIINLLFKMSKQNKNKNNNPPEKTQKEIEFESLSSFFDKYISNGQLIVKYATLYDIKRVSYVKGKDVKKFFNDNFIEIQKEILSITNVNIGKEANKDSLQKFYEVNQQHNIMHYLQRIPGDKAKYPKKLLPLKKGDDVNLEFFFTESGFYTLNIKIEKSNKPIFYLILLIIFILFIVLFPIWPLSVKLGVLYFLISCIIFLIAFLVLTIIIALVGILFGYDIYIMPNIDESKMSWKDRFFNPFIAIDSREDPCWFKIIRIILIISIIGICVIAYFYPTIPKECYNLFKSVMVSIYSYGKEKIEDIHYHRNEMKVRENQYLEDLDNL